jgi:hypothetical protein
VALEKPRGGRIDEDFVRPGPLQEIAHGIRRLAVSMRIDPKHRSAHEYIGEAFLVLGDLPKAKEHLAVLDKLCFFPCEEYSDLKKAVRDYETSGGRLRPASKSN